MPDDATAKVLIAGSFTKANAARLLDAQPSEGEPYIAFFVGASAAARLCLTAREQNRVFPPCSTRTAPWRHFAEAAHGSDGKALPSLSNVVGASADVSALSCRAADCGE